MWEALRLHATRRFRDPSGVRSALMKIRGQSHHIASYFQAVEPQQVVGRANQLRDLAPREKESLQRTLEHHVSVVFMDPSERSS